MPRLNNMKTIRIALLVLTLILGACTLNLPVTETVSTRPGATIPPPTEIPTLVPTVDTTYGGCGYQWAYADVPDVTAQFDAAVKELIPNSGAHATAFGENCRGADGQVLKFIAMETDFYVFITVDVLDEYETFGNWIAQVMQIVIALPAEMLMGPKPGFVAFRFEKSVDEYVVLSVPIQPYRETAIGITGEELFRMFYTQP